MKRIVSLSVASALALQAASVTLMPYYAYVDYEDSVRKSANIAGVYGAKWFDRTLVEGALGWMGIDYTDDAKEYKQFDLTLMGSYYYQNNWVIKGGIANIWSDTDASLTNYDNVLKVGVEYYRYNDFSLEGDLYVSNYDDFNVYQATVQYGQNFRVKEFAEQRFYARYALNQIRISKSGYAPNKNYTNFDIKLGVLDRSWSATIKASLGKSAYKVDQDGWVVYNLGEEYKYSVGADFIYFIDPRSTLKVGYSRSKFNENTSTDSYANTFLITYTIGF